METDQPASDASKMSRCEYSYHHVRCDKTVTWNSHFCTDHTNRISVDLEVYKSLHTRFHHFVDASLVRTNFFFLVQVGFFTVFTGVLSSRANQASLYLTLIDFVVGSLELALAFLWYKYTKSSLKYYKLWRGQVIKIDKVVDRRQHHAEIEEQMRSSLTGLDLTQWVSVMFIAGWLALLGVLLWLSLIH